METHKDKEISKGDTIRVDGQTLCVVGVSACGSLLLCANKSGDGIGKTFIDMREHEVMRIES